MLAIHEKTIHLSQNCICFLIKKGLFGHFFLKNAIYGHKKLVYAIVQSRTYIFTLNSVFLVNYGDKNLRLDSGKHYLIC